MGNDYELHRLGGSLVLTLLAWWMWWALSGNELGVAGTALLFLLIYLGVHALALWLAKR